MERQSESAFWIPAFAGMTEGCDGGSFGGWVQYW
jgi:hypothetical protein